MSRFTKGQSGNPAGRKPGITPGAKLRKSIEKDTPEIIQALILQAKDGNVAAAKVLLDRIIPPLKPQAAPVKLSVNGSLVDHGEAVIRAMLSGAIPPDVGSQLITVLLAQSKLVEIEEISARLENFGQQKNNNQDQKFDSVAGARETLLAKIKGHLSE